MVVEVWWWSRDGLDAWQMVWLLVYGVHGGPMRTESPESAWPPERRPQERALSHLPKEGEY